MFKPVIVLSSALPEQGVGSVHELLEALVSHSG